MSEEVPVGKVLVKGRKPVDPVKAAMKKADQAAIKLVHSFMKQYADLDEGNDAGHEENEQKLIDGLYDIYDPADEDIEAIQN